MKDRKKAERPLTEVGERRIMIVGEEKALRAAVKEFKSNAECGDVVCLIQDNSEKRIRRIAGVPVVGGREAMEEAAEKYAVNEIILTASSAGDWQKLRRIWQTPERDVRFLPSFQQIVNGDVGVEPLRKFDAEELLDRTPVSIDRTSLERELCGKTVLVTGGGGSIGSELCRQLAAFSPARLILFDVYENNAYDTQQQIKRRYPDLELIVRIGSIRDKKRVDRLFEEFRPDFVYHAAAHKHVPLMEDSPSEAVKNNVFGTLNVVNAAKTVGVRRFVLISTDKAVKPVSVMGATKRICEMIVTLANRGSKTDFVAVRFGNALGSAGSVVPLFQRQIEEGGPVTVTDPRALRYFMTIPEAAALTLQAGVYAEGGEIFVLDMGDSVNVDALARKMIRLSGLEPERDIQIEYTGLRPGEKLYEELMLETEGMKKTENSMIYIGRETEFDEEEFLQNLARLKQATDAEPERIRELLRRMIPDCAIPTAPDAEQAE